MFAIIGAGGNVGYATAFALREAGAPVRAILRDAAKAERLQEIGCEITLADIQDAGALADAIKGADSVHAILPLSPQATDPAADLRRSIDSLTLGLAGAGTKRVLAISDYGAHVEEDIGMPSLFREFEARLRQLDAHTIILRSAEHMHNWGRTIPVALASGTLPSFQDPVDMLQPTISAQDLGLISAELLLRSTCGSGPEIVHAEGPRRYGASDVATALGQLSGQSIHAVAVPRSQWEGIFGQSMPASLATLLIKASDAKNRGGLVDSEPGVGEIRYGTTSLIDALRPLVRQ
jgi:uncharacterized protein YbjT (DUF2867 family)